MLSHTFYDELRRGTGADPAGPWQLRLPGGKQARVDLFDFTDLGACPPSLFLPLHSLSIFARRNGGEECWQRWKGASDLPLTPYHRIVDPAGSQQPPRSATRPRSALRRDRTRPRMFRTPRRCSLPLECRLRVALCFLCLQLFFLCKLTGNDHIILVAQNSLLESPLALLTVL